jgi:hypothetical protein
MTNKLSSPDQELIEELLVDAASHEFYGSNASVSTASLLRRAAAALRQVHPLAERPVPMRWTRHGGGNLP